MTAAWEERASHGFWRALWLTWRESVFRPIPFFRALSPQSGRGHALSYCVLVSAVGLFFALYWSTFETVLGGGLDTGLAAQLDPGLTSEAKIILLIIGTAVSFVFLLLLNIALLFLGAALVHVGFVVVGAGRQGFNATFQATAYSYGPVLFVVFPFFGRLVAMVWSAVLLFIGVREVQRTTNGRATAGFLLPAVALAPLLVLAFYFVAMLLRVAEVEPTL